MSRKYITHDGQIRTIAEWARHLKINRKNLAVYLRNGYSLDDVINGRVRKQGQRTPEGEARRLAAVTHHSHAKDEKQSSEYRSWADMKNRCDNSNIKNYEFYGIRGITYCERWNSFDNFLADMGKKPSANHSLGRIDNNGNYEPTNCRWETREQQGNNRRDNVFLECDGQRMTISQWARKVGISRNTLYRRYRLGWSDEQIVKGNHPNARGPRIK
jgi:hypothetical protein